MPPSNTRSFDLSVPRRSHVGTVQAALLNLEASQGEYVHDHSGYKTPFPVWIAQNRHRLGRKFQYRKGDLAGQFVISTQAS